MWYTSRQYLVFYVVCIKAVPCDMHQSDALCSTCTGKWCLMFYVASSKAMPYVPHGTPGCDDVCYMWYAWRWYWVCHVVHIKTMPCVSMLFPSRRCLTFSVEHVLHVVCVKAMPYGTHESDALCSMWSALRWCPMFYVVCIKVMQCVPEGVYSTWRWLRQVFLEATVEGDTCDTCSWW